MPRLPSLWPSRLCYSISCPVLIPFYLSYGPFILSFSPKFFVLLRVISIFSFSYLFLLFFCGFSYLLFCFFIISSLSSFHFLPLALSPYFASVIHHYVIFYPSLISLFVFMFRFFFIPFPHNLFFPSLFFFSLSLFLGY